MTVIETLPKNFLVRHPSMDDVQAVYELLSICDKAEYGTPDLTEEALRYERSSPTLNLVTDVWFVFST